MHVHTHAHTHARTHERRRAHTQRIVCLARETSPLCILCLHFMSTPTSLSTPCLFHDALLNAVSSISLEHPPNPLPSAVSLTELHISFTTSTNFHLIVPVFSSPVFLSTLSTVQHVDTFFLVPDTMPRMKSGPSVHALKELTQK